MQNTMMKLQPVCRKMLHVFRRYFPGVRILKRAVKECINNKEPDQCYREFKVNKDRIACMRKHKWIVYLNAFDRFVEKYNGNVEVSKLSQEEL